MEKRAGIKKYIESWMIKGKKIEVYLLDESDRKDIGRLNISILTEKKMKTLFYAVEENILLECLNKRGFCLGAFCGGEMIGYRLVHYPGQSPDNFGLDANLPESELKYVAQFSGIVVAPDYRRQGIGSRMFSMALRMVEQEGFRYVTATCHPDNQNSLSIMIKNNFEIITKKKKYGGLIRYILLKKII